MTAPIYGGMHLMLNRRVTLPRKMMADAGINKNQAVEVWVKPGVGLIIRPAWSNWANKIPNGQHPAWFHYELGQTRSDEFVQQRFT